MFLLTACCEMSSSFAVMEKLLVLATEVKQKMSSVFIRPPLVDCDVTTKIELISAKMPVFSSATVANPPRNAKDEPRKTGLLNLVNAKRWDKRRLLVTNSGDPWT